MTSESSIMPVCMGSQFCAAVDGLPGRGARSRRRWCCGSAGSNGDRFDVAQVRVIGRRGDARPVLAAVVERNTPVSVPTTRICGAGGRDGERAHGLRPRCPGRIVKVLPPSALRATPPPLPADLPVADEDHAARVHDDLVEALSPRAGSPGLSRCQRDARVVRPVEHAVGSARGRCAEGRAGRRPARARRRREGRPGPTSARRPARATPARGTPLQGRGELPRRRCHGPLGV